MGVNGSVHTVRFFLIATVFLNYITWESMEVFTLCVFSDCDCVFKLHYMGVNGSVHTVHFFLIATVFLNYITWESMEVFTLCVFF